MKKVKKIIFVQIIVVVLLVFNSQKIYADDNEFSIDAKAALIVEVNSGKIIYEKNSDTQNYPASVTKILTAILTIENCNLDDTVTVSQSAISHIPTGYVIAPLYTGEEIRVEDLLYALMLKSANDAAYVLAEHVGGSVEGFSEMMNEKAEELGCKNSHFVNPNGIHNPNHYTTAHDMYLISKYAMENEIFDEIVSTYQYTLSSTNKHPYKDRIMNNTNNFINPKSSFYNKNVRGIKTGTTLQAGNCLITDSSENGLEFITVVLGAKTTNSKFSETDKMIKYSFDNYTLTNIHKKGEKYKSVEVEKATKETKNLNLIFSDGITVLNNKKTEVEEIEPEVTLNENIIAPISAGDEIGKIKYEVEGIEYEADLLAENDVIKKTYYKEMLIAGLVIVLIIIIVLCVKMRKRKYIDKT